MDKIENSQVERVLRDDELDTVNGGFGFVERFTNPLVIHGFNPQPESACRAAGTLAHVPEKWEPVFRIEHAQNRESRAHHNSIQSGCALRQSFDTEPGL